MDGPKMDHFFATKFYIYFSGNPQSNGWSSIFAGSKTLQKVIKITHFDALRGPFVDLEQASRRVHKIMQNYAKMHLKSPQNDHEKHALRSCNGKKGTPTRDVPERVKMRSLLRCPVLLCFRKVLRNHAK